MLLGEMSLADFNIAIELIKSFETFPQPNHNIKNKIPILMTKVNSHFLFWLLWLFLNLLINEV